VFSTALIGFSWLPVTVVLGSSFNRFKVMTSVLEGSDNSKLRQNFRVSGFYKSYVAKLNTDISKRLFSITNNLSKEISKLAPDSQSAVKQIEEIIKVIETKELRDFSNELENRISLPKKNSLKFKVSRLFTFFFFTIEAIYLSFKNSPLNPRIFTYIVTICTFGIAIRRNQNPIATLEYGIFIGSLTFMLTFAILFAWKLRVKYYLFVAILFTLINIYAPATLTHYFNNRGYAFAKIGSGKNFTLLWGSLIIVCLLLGHIGNASINAERNLFNFRKFNKLLSEIEGEMIKDQENLINHKWAVHIHGKIQTRLSTTVLALRQALTSNDNEGVLKALGSLQSLLQEPTAGFTQVQRDIESEVSERLTPWDGLLDSDIIIDPLLIGSRNIPTQLIGEVIEEIISNSVRHGAATEIRIEIRKIGSKKLLIRTEDNAVNIPPSAGVKGKGGVGTSIFNAASDGRWSLKRDEKRAKTVFEMRMDTINTSI
jgi:two-component sensor histidine kinase